MVTEPLKFGDAPKFFDPSDRAHKQDTDTVHGHMSKLHKHLKNLFIKFLRCEGGESKKLLLKWIGQVMNEHACLFKFYKWLFFNFVTDNKCR